MRPFRSLLVFVIFGLVTSGWACDDHTDGVAATTKTAIELAAQCKDSPPPATLTVEPQAINTTPPTQEPVAPLDAFLAQPTTAHLVQVRLFSEGLTPTSEPQGQDNEVLATALRQFVQQLSTAPLDEFLRLHPDSPWSGSLALNVGLIHRQAGRFSRALASWTMAWERLRSTSDDSRLLALRDRSAGELAHLLAWVGEEAPLAALLDVMKGRPRIGPGAARLEAAEMALSFMRSSPEITFTCGPFGVDTLLRLLGKSSDAHDLIRRCPATKKGIHLWAVSALATEAGLAYRPAQRVASANIPLPALVHWRLGHYSVVAKREGGRYLIIDQTFDAFQGRELWMTEETLGEESSGYFLIAGSPTVALPSGWVGATKEDLMDVWGKGAPAGIDPDQGGCGAPSAGGSSGGGGGGGEDGGGGGCAGMPVYALYPSQIAIGLADMPLGYRPPRGPAVEFILRYNSKEAHLPASPVTSNLGPKWNHNWLSYIVDDPSVTPGVTSYQVWNPVTMQYDTQYTVSPVSTNVERYPRGGGYERYSLTITYQDGRPGFRNATSGLSVPQARNQNTLERTGNASYRIITAGRTIYTYARADVAVSYPRRILLSSVEDQWGNRVSLSYDATNRLTGITDALGRVTTFTYGNADATKITRVTDPFGRSANFTYAGGVLNQVTDVVNLPSSFGYEAGTDVVSSMTTPYGTTTFSRGIISGVNGYEDIRWVEATDAVGDKERAELAHGTMTPELPTGDLPADIPTGLLVSNNIRFMTTYFWDKKAMRLAPGDRRKARAFGFARAGNLVTEVLEYIKPPDESRVWFNYPGQTTSASTIGVTMNFPTAMGRVIDDGTTQLSKTSYNSSGHVTETTDPLGRKLGYTYDGSGRNLIEVRMTTGGSTDLLMKATYNALNLIETATDANGRVTQYAYNSFGQRRFKTLPQRAGQPVEKIEYTYNAQGYLTHITDSLSGITEFTYDGYDRIRTIKNPDAYTLTYDYDHLDRLTKVTFPDGTFTQTTYNRLDAEWASDREGRWTRFWYDHLRKVVATRDSAGRVTGLSWCRCGALASLQDPMGRLTVWNYDLQGRLTSKVYPDGTANIFSYAPKSGRLASQTDAKGQITQYEYFSDNKLKQVSYLNAQVATPSVSYGYDSTYGRLANMTDGTGETIYLYNTVPLNTPVPAITGAGQLASIDGPLTNDTSTFTYDEWSRTLGAAINGTGQAAQLDAIGRVTQITNALGVFNYAYVGATSRLDNVVAPNGMKTIMTYQTLVNDFRVASIRHQTSAAARISEFGYQYSPAGRIQEWKQQADNATATVWSYGYDAVEQLTSARATSGTATGALIKEYGWQYDAMGNRLSERLSTTSSNAIGKSTTNNLNQLMSTAGGGRMQVRGQIDEPGTVTVNGSAIPVNSDKTFVADVDTVTGSNTFTVQATDLKGNVRTNQFQINTTANGTARALAYDLNGNCTQDGTTTYGWDAQNRLVWVAQGTKRSEFTYDGVGRRVRVVEKDGAATLSDQRFVWLGATIAERRNASGDTVQMRFLGVGEIEGATKRYYTRDHLGSVREVVDQTGATLARYEYDMFGSRTRVGGSDAMYVCSFGYTGHVHHAPTGMALAWFRAYNPASGRWLSRDPIEEAGGVNLYGYVGNKPTFRTDPLGLCEPLTATAAVVVVGATIVVAYGISAIMTTDFSNFSWPSLPSFPAGGSVPNSGVGWDSTVGPMWPSPGRLNPPAPSGAGSCDMAKGGWNNELNEYSRPAKKEKDPCKFLRALYDSETDTQERRKIYKAMKSLGCSGNARQ